MSKKGKLFIVSNRLPVNFIRGASGPEIKPSSGGLVSAMNSFLQHDETIKAEMFSEVIWCGCPGCTEDDWKIFHKQLKQESFSYLPVFIDKKVYRGYYDGFSNTVVWPLFHYFSSFAEYNSDNLKHYTAANRSFAEVLSKHIGPDDIVWIHDYHLLLLAKMLREKNPGIPIGFFLHIPFPSYEIFRLIPRKWGHALLEGMLGADIIGFHTNDFAMHFLKSVQRIMGYEDNQRIIRFENRLIKTDIFPISIDFEKFNSAYNYPEIEKQRKDLLQKFTGSKIIFSVDRLDYTKGISYRLSAYKTLLDEHPEYRGKVVFILIIVPSRISIDKYSERKRMINEAVGNINSIYGTLTWQPLIYRYAHLEFAELSAFYTACDLALITPIRDGMNLVAKEFVASRKDKHGVLVLSEMAGAASELGESLIVNPIDKEDMVLRIRQALNMPEQEQEFRMNNMQQRIKNYDVKRWAEDFLSQLRDIHRQQNLFSVQRLSVWKKMKLVAAYIGAKRRLLLLDYDGTLAEFADNPEKAAPTAEVMQVLKRLTASSRNEVFIVSGRSIKTLEQWFGSLPIHLIAEHGARIKLKGGKWINTISSFSGWKTKALEIMRSYEQRCAGSFVEEKEFSIGWHYRRADNNLGDMRAKELFSELSDVFKNVNVQVINGNKVVELRSLEADKGKAVTRILSDKKYDFIFCVGDDRTDEDMFRALKNSGAWTIKVGLGISSARYNLQSPRLLLSLLGLLT